MATPKQHTKKGRKKSFLCSFGGCFGISTKVSADHGDGKWVSGRQGRGAPPVNDHYIPAPAAEILSLSKEIHVVEDDHEEKRSPSADEFMSNIIKAGDLTSEKSKNRDEFSPIIKRGEKQNSAAHDTWTNHRKLSHSVSLPLIYPGAAAGGGEKKGKKVKEVAVGGEFDSKVGAVIITVTLVVMIIWGKVCAILCTAAWFYLMPRFKANLDRSYAIKIKNGESDRVDFDSREYKKKVVLQGLLDRNQNL